MGIAASWFMLNTLPNELPDIFHPMFGGRDISVFQINISEMSTVHR